MYWPDVRLENQPARLLAAWLALVCLDVLGAFWPGDANVVEWIHNAPWVTAHLKAIHFVTDWGMVPFYVLFLGVLWVGWRRRQSDLKVLAGGYLLAQLTGSVCTVRVLKVLLGRTRPIVCGGICPSTWVGPTWSGEFHSFPSGHMADLITSAVFVALLSKNRGVRALVFLWAVVVGWTRVALAEHYPSDVVAGALIGGLASWLTWRLWMVDRLAAGDKQSRRLLRLSQGIDQIHPRCSDRRQNTA